VAKITRQAKISHVAIEAMLKTLIFETRFELYLINKRHRLSSSASKSSEHVVSPIASRSQLAASLAFSAASFIWSHSKLVL
jgi:hypothetical protein